MHIISQFSKVFILIIMLFISSCNEKDIIIIDSYYQFWSGGIIDKNSKLKNRGTYYHFKFLVNSTMPVEIDSLKILNKKIDFNIFHNNKKTTSINQGDTITILGSSYKQIPIPQDKSIKANIYYSINGKQGSLPITKIREGDVLNYQ